MPRGVESPAAQAARFEREADEWNRKAKASWRGMDSATLIGLRGILSQQKAEVLDQVARLAKSAAGIDANLDEVESLINAARKREGKEE